MARSYVVVDGSNIATEGRSTPSLAQLDDAVRQFQQGFPDTEVIVVVDASFGRRIDPAEHPAFEEAVAHGELVSPPAGAVGRGDAFLLRIAERVGAQVLSNDSFQEFHGEHPWLFDEGRLVGGKPVPGVGWFFMPRSPVRGPRSRAARSATKTATGASAGADIEGRTRNATSVPTKSAKKAKAAQPAKATKAAQPAKATKAAQPAKAPPAKTAKASKAVGAQAQKASKSAKPTTADKPSKTAKKAKTAKAAKADKVSGTTRAASAQAVRDEATSSAPAELGPSVEADVDERRGGRRRRRRRPGTTAEPTVRAAIDAATVEAVVPTADLTDGEAAGTRRRPSGSLPAAVNDPLTFLTFVTEHPLGSSVEGVVSSFVSHGAMVDVDGMQCYVPLAGLATPPPRRAREVLERGERRTFVVVALDPPRRGAELALPELASARITQ